MRVAQLLLWHSPCASAPFRATASATAQTNSAASVLLAIFPQRVAAGGCAWMGACDEDGGGAHARAGVLEGWVHRPACCRARTHADAESERRPQSVHGVLTLTPSPAFPDADIDGWCPSARQRRQEAKSSTWGKPKKTPSGCSGLEAKRCAVPQAGASPTTNQACSSAYRCGWRRRRPGDGAVLLASYCQALRHARRLVLRLPYYSDVVTAGLWPESQQVVSPT